MSRIFRFAENCTIKEKKCKYNTLLNSDRKKVQSWNLFNNYFIASVTYCLSFHIKVNILWFCPFSLVIVTLLVAKKFVRSRYAMWTSGVQLAAAEAASMLFPRRAYKWNTCCAYRSQWAHSSLSRHRALHTTWCEAFFVLEKKLPQKRTKY